MNSETREELEQSDEYVNFGDLVRDEMGVQAQYVSTYLDEDDERYSFRGDPREYHFLYIPVEDTEAVLQALREEAPSHMFPED